MAAKKQPRQTETGLIRTVRERLEHAYLHDRDNRLDAAQDMRFLAGDQWPANVRSQREQQNRPVLTLNRLPSYVFQVVNDFKANPPAIKAVPATDEVDSGLLDAYNGIFSEIQYKSNAINVFGAAYAHAVSCGIGNFRIETGYVSDDSFDQEIRIRRIPFPLSVFWDPNAVEPSRSDAEWCLVIDQMTEKAFKDKYPDIPPESVHVPIDEQFGVSRLYWRLNDLISIAEYWQKVSVTRTLAMFEGGQAVDITNIAKDQLVHMPNIVQRRTVETHEVRQWLVTGSKIIDGGIEGNLWPGMHIPIISVVGAEIPLEDKVIRHGLIRFARDPQQLYNYWQSAITESIALQPKAPYLATPKMIAKYKGQWDTQNTITRPYLLYEPDPEAPGARPTREAPPPMPSAMLEQSKIAVEDMKAITNIYDASLGNRSNETSGRAIIARQHQGDIGTYHFLENFNASLVHAGVVINDLIPHIYDSERPVRLPGEEHETPKFATINKTQMQANGIPMIVNDVRQAKFDIRVKIGPSFATRRMEAIDSLMKLIQSFPQAAQVAGDLIVNLLDVPGAEELAARLKRAIPPQILGDDQEQTPEQQMQKQQAMQQQQQQQQMQQQMAQLEMLLKQAETSKTGSEAKLKDAEATLKQVEAYIASKTADSAVAQAHTNALQGLQDVHSKRMQSAQQADQHAAQMANLLQPQGPSPDHAEIGALLENMLKKGQLGIQQQQLRRVTALADEASAGTQSRILDNALKQQKLGQDRISGY
jgi:hypothetical protein